jgi:HEPN domain-containing protein
MMARNSTVRSRTSAPGSAAEWLSRAKGSLVQAKQPKAAEGYWEDLCYLAHQAAEKALKAVYQQNHWLFHYTHDIEELVTGLGENGMRVPDAVKDAVILTRYAVHTRYPGVCEPVKKREYQRAVRLAQGVLDWAEPLITK